MGDISAVDAIMKKVEQDYRGVFTINGDNLFSSNLQRELREKDNKFFNGYNGSLSLHVMNCNDLCVRKESSIELQQGGVVYGPYYRFAPGKYIVEFIVRVQPAGRIDLDVCAANIGVIAQQELQGPLNLARLSFEFQSSAEQVEFRIRNQAKSGVILTGITILEAQKQLSASLMPQGVKEAEPLIVLASKLGELNRYNNMIQTEINAASKASACAMPTNTRLKFIKKIIRKLMNVYTAFQISFNSQIVGIVRNLFGKINAVDEALQEIFESVESDIQRLREEHGHQLLELKEELKKNMEIEAIWKKIQQYDGEFGSLWNKVGQFDADLSNQWKFNSDTNQNLNSIWSTYQMFRQEMFYELDSRIRRISQMSTDPHSASEVIVPKIKSSAEQKIIQADGKLRLNLGSGAQEIPGYVNVDARDLPTVDVIADISNLPYTESSLDEIFSAHVLEHFSINQLEKELLPYWRNMLKPQGLFRVIFPDFDAMLQDYSNGAMNFEQLALVTMGGQDYALDYHYSVFTVERVTHLLESAGFHNITVVERGRKNDICRESEIIATKERGVER